MSEHKNKYYFISLPFSLIFLANFGRGVFLLLCFLAWYGVVKLFEWTKSEIRTRGCAALGNERTAANSQLSFWLVVLWIVGAQLSSVLQPIETTVGGGELRSIWDALYRFSFGYGVATKQLGSVLYEELF